MKALFAVARAVIVVVLACIVLALGGCATTDSENVSERPWDSPQGWEHGLPSSMTEGH
jgi:hypothetical protein